MAFFAMIAVLASPALAFACCCGQENAPVPVTQTLAPPVPATSASHPSCHGHAEASVEASIEAGVVRAQNVDVSRVSAATSPPRAPGVAPSHLCFKSLCECSHSSNNALTFVAEQNGSSFSPLVLGVASPLFFNSASLPSLVSFAFASEVARPRGPDLASRAGRAPPAFSL